jgi:hypothetical protein
MTSEESKILSKVEAEVKTLGELLRGNDKGGLGIAHQVRLMLKFFWLWPISIASFCGGIVVTLILQKIFHQ